ncbi:PACE efflux transporter [Nocardiopsis sp. HUAS JQ3]|uniref:PACE efflux transporter n=1 Tax=Nocardiopsis sp. HUAS JQ3 TaxID=3061629 RepID=UPI0023A95E5C|nr:PACE efflux transporter [Nocardiopsis sp. HUAS JQ3]WDZ90348.1 PACE efflux transporter [Nocardiopsis sp. HUAS JQ3]
MKRKLVYVGGYEVLGLAVGTAVMSLLTGESPATTGPLALMITCVATVWNLVFNYLFEAWERRQRDRTRTVRRRVLHAVGFQLTLVCFLIPLIAWWLEITLLQAFVLDLVFIVYIPFYTFAYNWAFDRIFGVPSSAVNEVEQEEPVGSGRSD